MKVEDLKITAMVKDNKQVTFSHFKEGHLWYVHDETGFEFPVPVDDVGSATMLAKDKAMLFMRYMRKHIEMLSQAKTEAHAVAA